VIKSIIHIVISFSVFFSSAGFWINSHYCQDKYVKTSFILNFGSCCAGEGSASCSGEKKSCSQEDSEDEDDCCSSESSFHKLEQTQQIQLVDFQSIEKPSVSTATLPIPKSVLPLVDNRSLQHDNYAPPLIVYDRQVRLQTFLC